MKVWQMAGAIFFSVATGCIHKSDLENRAPAAKFRGQGIVFNLQEPDYSFLRSKSLDLIDFSELKRKNVKFQKISMDEILEGKQLSEWLVKAQEFKKEVFADPSNDSLFFPFGGYSVKVKSEDFDNLAAALAELDMLNESSQIRNYKKAIIIDSFNANFESPYEFDTKGLSVLKQVLNREEGYKVSNGGETPATVASSVFWQDRNIQEEYDLILADETQFQTMLESHNCVYDGAKKGYGINLNFKVKCGKRKFKLKMGEFNAAPMNSKIYRMLGYHVPKVYFGGKVNVKWDSKIFTEMNQSRSVKTLFGEVKVKPNYKQYISGAYLKTGDFVPGNQFLERLSPQCIGKDPQCLFQAEKIDSGFSETIDKIEFKSVAMLEEDKLIEFGRWSYDDLDFPHRLELKSLLLVGALTGNHDLRKDNTSLVMDAQSHQVKFYLSDIGSGYGPPKIFSGSDMKQMTYEIMKESQEGIDIFGFSTNATHKSFKNLKLEEGKWMARRILQIDEEKIKKCLSLSGYSENDVALGVEKLLSRQKNIGQSFKIIDEFPALKDREIERVQTQKK